MARQGRAGAALGIAAFGSFIAGVLVTAALFVVGPALADVALAFGPAEYTALVLLGLLLVTQLSSGSQVDALAMVAFGLLLSTVGKDPIYGTERFTFHIFSLFDGLNIALLAMGVFGVAELLVMAEGGSAAAQPVGSPGCSSSSPTAPTGARARCRSCAAPCWFLPRPPARRRRHLVVVHLLRVGAAMAREPARFGHGAIEGVAGPESANNAAAQSSFVPLLSLGIPANAVMGVILGALLIQGITPGPTLVANRPDIFFGVIASMLIGNLMLIVLNVPLISLFVQLLRLPGSILAPLIIVFCVIGAYTLQQRGRGDHHDRLRHRGLPHAQVALDPAPLVLAFVLGNILETNFRQALLVGKGSLSLFYTRPIAAALVACCVVLIALQVGRGGAGEAQAGLDGTLLVRAGCARIIVLPCPTSRPLLRRRSLRPRHRPLRAKAGGASSRARRFRSSWLRSSGRRRRSSASFRTGSARGG